MCLLHYLLYLKNLALYCPAVGEHAGGYLAENGYFVDKRYEHLGGVGLLKVELPAEGLQYRFFLCDNMNAVNPVKLPMSTFQGHPRYSAKNRPR